MALSDEQMNFVRAGLANPDTAEEVKRVLQVALDVQTALNALLDELETRRDATQGIESSADGFYEGLKVE